MTAPGANDWIICTVAEIADLRRRFPAAALLPCHESALHGRVLAGRAYITYLASRSRQAERVHALLRYCAAKADGDPKLYRLDEERP